MACVTLKRPLDFDPLETLHSPDRPPTKRRRCTPIKNVDRESANLRCQTSMEPSVFRESPLSPSEIANYLRDELKRLRKRRQIVTSDSATSVTVAVAAAAAGPRPRSPPASPGSPEPMVEGQQGHVYQEQQQQQRATSLMIANTGGVLATANLAITPPRPTATATAAASSSSAANKKTDRPVFTLKQMTMICEKMCQERTDQVREEYDRILQQKLSEQYDAFVKFIDHQIQQRFNQSQLPSYLS